MLADFEAGLKIIEVTNPYNPVQVGYITSIGDAEDVSIMKKDAKIYVVLANYNHGLTIINITDPKNPVLVGSIYTGG